MRCLRPLPRSRTRRGGSNTAALIVDVISHNPILCTPIKDNQAIDIDIACHFLKRIKRDDFIRKWIGDIARATMFAFHTNGPYPCIYDDYRDRLDHPHTRGVGCGYAGSRRNVAPSRIRC